MEVLLLMPRAFVLDEFSVRSGPLKATPVRFPLVFRVLLLYCVRSTSLFSVFFGVPALSLFRRKTSRHVKARRANAPGLNRALAVGPSSFPLPSFLVLPRLFRSLVLLLGTPCPSRFHQRRRCLCRRPATHRHPMMIVGLGES